MFGGQSELIPIFSDIQKRIQPGVKIARSAKTVAGSRRGRGVFSEMVDERDGGAALALQRSQVAEQGGDISAGILIGHVDSDQWVEDQKRWPVKADCGIEPDLIVGTIQAQRVGDNHAYVELFEIQSTQAGDRLEAAPERGGGFLRRVQQNRAGGVHRKGC